MSGNRFNILLTDPDTTQTIVKVQYGKNIGGVGFANLMPLLSSLYALDAQVPSHLTGNLILAEYSLEAVETLSAFYTHWLTLACSFFGNFTQPADVKRSLDSEYPLHYREPHFSLLNMQNAKRVKVGSVRGRNCTLSSTVFFLGNTTEAPQNAKLPLPISGNFGVNNVVAFLPNAGLYYYGAMLAVEQVNLSPTLLDNFQLELFNFTAGVTIWNYTFAYQHVYPIKDKLGLAVISRNGSAVTVRLIEFLSSLGFKGPVIGSVNTADSLSDKGDFQIS